ncbi:MAG: DUF493 domain-containing protein [Flavobacteriaceae bacterium]|jgi:putative lipoic acid-binding regulatory protein|nr:DUF493 domain-containing protein [Flavobacteriaceae bacterium]
MKRNAQIEVLASEKQENPEVFYARFKEQLDAEHHFPENYMFKFVIPTNTKKMALLHQIFDHNAASFSTKESKNAKYISVTVIIFAVDSTAVIEYYKEAAKIEDIIML